MDAAGRLVPNARTIAFLVARGVGDVAVVERLLRRRHRAVYPAETVQAVYAWLATVLRGCIKRGISSDVPPITGVALVVRKYPTVLIRNIAALKINWDFLQAPEGLGLSRKQACAALMSSPRILTSHKPEHILQTAMTLAELGVADAPAFVAQNGFVLELSSAALHAKADVLRRHGFDAGSIICAQPHVLSLGVRANALDTKLHWLLHVAGYCAADVQANAVLLNCKMGRMRPRFFLARQLGVEGRCKEAKCMTAPDAVLLTDVLHDTDAASWSVEAYKQHIASPEFLSYMDVKEAALRARHAASG